MAPFKFLSVASASVFLLHGTYTAEAGGTTGSQDDLNHITVVDCLASINQARAAVDFPAMKTPTSGTLKTTLSSTDNEVDGQLCAAVNSSTGAPTLINSQKVLDGYGFAYHGQTGATGDCAAAAAFFQSGITALGGQKPGQYAAGEAPFNTVSAFSFASVFNPSGGELECVYIDCTKAQIPQDGKALAQARTAGTDGNSATGENTESKDSSSGGNGATDGNSATGENTESKDSSSGGNGAESKDGVKRVLFCTTKPPTLVQGKEPFTDDQFKSLQKLTNNTSAAVPAFLSLLVAAAGLNLL